MKARLVQYGLAAMEVLGAAGIALVLLLFWIVCLYMAGGALVLRQHWTLGL